MSEKHLREFAKKVLAGYLCAGEEVGDIDGGDLQDWAEQCGLLKAEQVTEPCGEFCGCADYGDFPMTCYKATDCLTGADGGDR